MTTPIDQFELRIHLIDQQVLCFRQDDAELARRNLVRILPERIFREPTLTLAGDLHVTTIHTSFVTRIDIFMNRYPQWSFGPTATDVRLMEEDDFRQTVRRGQEDGSLRRLRALKEGDIALGYHELTLTSRERLFVVTEGVMRGWPVQARALSRAMQSDSLLARNLEGGRTLLNPATVVSIVSYPGPQEISSESLLAHQAPGR